jgi:hypothetical protein
MAADCRRDHARARAGNRVSSGVVPGFDEACRMVEATLAGPHREDLASEYSLRSLRGRFREHTLAPFVPECDRLTRADGFHALNDWDGKAAAVNPEIIPVDVLDWLAPKLADASGESHFIRRILLDYYFFHVLALLTLRIWDEGDADANLDRVDRLLDRLQGPGGSGHLFVDHATTLMLVATSHYEADERAYASLLERVRGLNDDHRAAVALDHAGCLGCHLRFGLETTYVRDVSLMRQDNAADYPWLSFAVETLLEEYARRPDRRTAEGILNALSADSTAVFRDASDGARRLRALREPLLADFEALAPSEQAYSPLSLFFNFSHNVVKGTLVDALLTGEPWDATLNDLLTAIPAEAPSGPRGSLAVTLMGYARAFPDRIAGRLRPVIVYDPAAGRQGYRYAMRNLPHK